MCFHESNDDDFKSAVNYNTANCIDSRRVGSRHIDNLANEYLCTRRKSIETGGVCFHILAIIQLGLCVNDFSHLTLSNSHGIEGHNGITAIVFSAVSY